MVRVVWSGMYFVAGCPYPLKALGVEDVKDGACTEDVNISCTEDVNISCADDVKNSCAES